MTALVVLALSWSGADAKPPLGKLGELDVTVGKAKRTALVYAPMTAAKTDAPVVFAFHGHGGTAEKASAEFGYHTHWPEAITVYMQGQPIPSTTDPQGKKAGWQHEVGQVIHGVKDRDLEFF